MIFGMCYVGQNNKRNKWHEGSIRQRPDGRFEGRVSIKGVKKYLYGKSYIECQRKLKSYILEQTQDESISGNITLSDFCRYFLYSKKLAIEISTYNRLDTIIRLQISNYDIGGIKLSDIRAHELQRYFNNLAIDPDNLYTYNTIKTIFVFVSSVLSYANKNGNIISNPMINVRLPKERYCIHKGRDTFSMSPEQIKDFKLACFVKNKSNNSYRYRYSLPLLLILNTGLRLGEMLALEWKDVDFKKNIIYINKAMQYNLKVEEQNKRQTYINSPKTKYSNRVIPMNEEIFFILKEIERHNKEKDITTQYVCCDKNGNYARARNLQRAMKMIIADTDLPDLWIHLLRHTFGSELIRKGTDISVVSRIMGHSNINTTYNTYIHVLNEEIAKAMILPDIS